MGEKDVAERMLVAYNDVFADITNGLIFKGRRVIREGELGDAQPFSTYKADGRTRLQERDVAKYWRKGRIRIGFIGLENQTAPDIDMPLRIIGYDGAAYRAQLGGTDGARYPVVTIVLYFGTERRWTAPSTLKERLGKLPPGLEAFVSDYKIHVVELAWLDDVEVEAFHGDFRDVVEYLRCQRKHEVYRGTDRKIRHVHEVLELLRLISRDDTFTRVEPKLVEKSREEGGPTMFDMVRAIQEEGIAIGERQGIAIGERQGIAIGERQGIAIGERQGIAIGERQGIAAGRDSLYGLLAELQAEGRSDEVAHILSDRSYMERLLEERQAQAR